MPSTARIVIFCFILVLPAGLSAQTHSDPSTDPSPTGQSDAPPDWVKPLPETSSESVRVPPPLPAADKTELQSPLKRESHIPLSPSSKINSQESSKNASGLPSMITVAGSLGIVSGLFLLVAWLIRRATPQGLTRLPNDAFEVLGRAPLAGRQNVHLVRCGNKLLLVSVTPAGTETLTEITDPQEVDRLAGLCRQVGPHSSTAAFRQIFEQLAPKRPSRAAFSKDDYADYDPSRSEFTDAMAWEQHDA